MKRPNSNGDSKDSSKRHVTDRFDRSFETVSTIESLSDSEDPIYHPNERFNVEANDINNDNDDFLAHDDTLVMSFDEIHSNIVSDDDDANPPTSDPIAGFTDDDGPIGAFDDELEKDDIGGGSSENYPQNILDGLDDWQPTPGFRSSTQQSSSPTFDDDDSLGSFVTDDDGLASSQQQQQQQGRQHERGPSIVNQAPMQERTPARIEGAPIPDFRLQSASLPKVYPKLPVTATNNSNNTMHHRHHHHNRHQDPENTPKPKPLNFKTDGPAADILRRISGAAEDHAAWESKVRAEMAKLGSLPQVCSLFDNATLFRILDSWVERGLTFGRCVQVRPSELAFVMQQASGRYDSYNDNYGNSSNNDDDIIEDLASQPATLPPYTPIEGEQEFTFLFSFAYMPQIQSSVKTQFLQEECVAVWMPWTVVSDTQREIYVATRFLSYSMY